MLLALEKDVENNLFSDSFTDPAYTPKGAI